MIFNNVVILVPAALCVYRYYWFEAVFFVAVGIASTLYHTCWATAYTDDVVPSDYHHHQFEECILQDYTILLGLDMVLSCNAICLTAFHVLFKTEIMVIVCTMASVSLSVMFQHSVDATSSALFAFVGVAVLVLILVVIMHHARQAKKVLQPMRWRQAVAKILRERVEKPKLFWWGIASAVAGGGFLAWDLAGWATVYSYPHAIWHLFIMIAPFLVLLSTKPRKGVMCCGKSRREVQDERGLTWLGDPKILWAMRSPKVYPSKPTLPT